MNSIFLDGNIGQDPEIKLFPSGQKVSKFSLAVNEGYKNKEGEWINKTMWIDIVSWGRSAEYVENNFTKGMKIAVSGKLSIRSYEDKEGKTRYVTEVISNTFTAFIKKESSKFTGIEDTGDYVDADAPAKTNFETAAGSTTESPGDKLNAGDLDDLPF